MNKAKQFFLRSAAAVVMMAQVVELVKAQAVFYNPPMLGPVRQHPGYPSGRFWPVYRGTTTTNTSVATLDTLYAYPFTVEGMTFKATSLNTRTTTGSVGCSIKMAVWAHSDSTFRATGRSIAGTNTQLGCGTSGNTQISSIAYIFQPGLVYWAGIVVDSPNGPVSFISTPNQDSVMTWLVGRSAIVNNMITGISTPFGTGGGYAGTDITAFDLTSVTWTDVTGASGIPVLYLGN